MLLLFTLLSFLLINTFNLFVSPLSYFSSPLLCSRHVDYDGLAPFVRRYLESQKKKNVYLGGGKGKSVAPTCLWQSDSMLVVTHNRLRWDARGWEGRRGKIIFEVSKANVLTRAVLTVEFFASRGAGLKMSSADRCPHPELSNLATRQCTYYHITLFPIKT